MTDDVEAAAASIGRSRKYQHLCPDTIRDIVTLEMARHRSLKNALPYARRRLHRLWASFLGEPDYRVGEERLEQAFGSGNDTRIRAACRSLLETHASSAERLPEFPGFYERLFERTGRPRSIADLACALNPLSFQWMGLERQVRLHAFDINRRTVELVNYYFRLEGLAELAEWRDVLCTPPTEPVDVALLLKMYHCLEHRQTGAGWRAVESVPARWLAISFPTRNLHDRRVDIRGNYEPTIREKAAARGWEVSELSFPSEVILLMRKST